MEADTMITSNQEHVVEKKALQDKLHDSNQSTVRRYQNFFVGSTRFGDLVKYELLTMLFGPMPGALGLAARKTLYPSLFKQVGGGVVLGRNLALRHAYNIVLGDRVAIDDDCMLDAQGAGPEGIRIDNDVMIARGTMIQGKGGPITIGEKTVIGSQAYFGSISGIHVGRMVMISGQCYIGGGRYRTDDLSKPMMEQPPYSKGPTIIEDDVWIGAGAVIQDGVHIARGSVIGAGAVIREDVPEYTMVVPHQRLISLPRNQGE